MKIIFLDIDGPLIPLRMFFGGSRPYNYDARSFVYDPVAVGMINKLAETTGAQVVFNSAHCENTGEVMAHQARVNGLAHMHEKGKTDYIFNRDLTRESAMYNWMQRFGRPEKWIVIDDCDMKLANQIVVNYDAGLSIHDFVKAHHLLGHPLQSICSPFIVQPPDLVGRHDA